MIVDLSHTIEDGLVTYKGLPPPIVCEYLSREASKQQFADGTSFHIGKIEMVANTGTYIDAPFHRFEGGRDIAGLSLKSIAGVDAVVIRAANVGRALDHSLFHDVGVRDKAVLIETGWSRHWNTEQYYEGHTYLTESAALYLQENGARIVGIDSYNIDDTGDGRRPVHTVLLGAGIPIVEHLGNLDAVPDTGFRFSAVPPKVKAFGTFPVRAFAEWAPGPTNVDG